ncbi:transmembrane protein 144-like [Mytilus californianus]|uniref:transmembrane protein 144-like n=1 Tax=Mytilus californianus TaxID=6549 RepID=UPI002247FDF1|nr:transmembrane protein 144-like [Mytilus californianus]
MSFSAFVFVLVKTEVSPIEEDEKESLLTKELQKNASSISFDTAGEEKSYVDSLSPGMQRIVGLILCIFSGLMYGQMFTGATYVQDHLELYPGATLNGLDYVFADFCGIYVTSTVFFVTYIIVMKFKPKVYPKVMIPALISGVMWAIGNSCWFVANRSLSIPVAFPIVTTGPSIVASLWGVLVFKEIKGTYNLLILVIAFTMGITGAILAGVSKH